MRISPLLRTKQHKGQTSVVINLPRALFLKVRLVVLVSLDRAGPFYQTALNVSWIGFRRGTLNKRLLCLTF